MQNNKMKLMWICIATSVSIVSLVILDSVEAQIKRYKNFDEFLSDLKTTADNLFDYVTKMQALFCPNQPVCGLDGELERYSALATLPTYLFIDNVTVKVDEIAKSVGVCCLPCSCNDSCWQDGSCCPTKQMLPKVPNDTTVTLKSECIVASIRSYSDKSDIESYHLNHQYRMITNCFHDTTNHTLVERCHHPDAHSMADRVPVTSRSTGHTYWNYACAVCNGDNGNLMEWTPIALFKMTIPYFSSSLQQMHLPDTYEQLLQLLSSPRLGDIIYTRPVDTLAKGHKCITDDSFHAGFCRDNTFANEDWLIESCRQLYCPVRDNKAVIYTNIFCFVCLTSAQLNVDGPGCNIDDEIRTNQGYMLALLNYKAQPETAAIQDVPRRNDESCKCAEIYDPYLKRCRPLFCRAGEIRKGCRCIVLLKNFTGLPVALITKVKPESKVPDTLTSRQLQELHAALEEALETVAMNTTVEIVVTLKQQNVTRQTYLCMAIVQSDPGVDTKLAMRPFLKYLDADIKLDLKIGRLYFSTALTTKARIWIGPSQNHTPYEYRGYWLGSKTNELVQIYADVSYVYSRVHAYKYQKLSRLLYCKQVQLDTTEYAYIDDDIVMVNATDLIISTSDYYPVSPLEIRVCADTYLMIARGKAVNSARALCTAVLMLFVSVFIV